MGGRPGNDGRRDRRGEARVASPSATTFNSADFTVQSASIVVDGQQVGSAEIYAPRGARAAAEDAYQGALTRNLIIAAAIAGVLALLVSLLVSRRITARSRNSPTRRVTSPPATWTCACRRAVTTRWRRLRRPSTPWPTGWRATSSGGAT